jgi:hypothetical protein
MGGNSRNLTAFSLPFAGTTSDTDVPPVLQKMLSVAHAFKISDHQYNPR